MSEQQGLQKVAFLDTNTLHYIGLYLEYAKEKDLFPFGSEAMQGEKDDAIREVHSLAEADLRKSLKRGLQTFDFLLTQDVQVQYATVSELELLNGRTRGRAVMSAAKEGVPDRMWSRIRGEEIRERISLEDMAETKKGIDRLSLLLEESGVAVRAREGEQTRDALELAKSINGLVYVDAMDSIIYASALLARSDFLMTGDDYFKNTVNLIHHGNGKRYEEINKRLKCLVSQITFETTDQVELPSAHSISVRGTAQPQLPRSNG